MILVVYRHRFRSAFGPGDSMHWVVRKRHGSDVWHAVVEVPGEWPEGVRIIPAPGDPASDSVVWGHPEGGIPVAASALGLMDAADRGDCGLSTIFTSPARRYWREYKRDMPEPGSTPWEILNLWLASSWPR